MKRRYILAMVLASIGALAAAAPAAAYKHLGTTGNTGTHSLTDTRAHPGATCKYRLSEENGWLLRRIEVNPPNADASAFHSGDQQVGWKFSVDRRVRCLCDKQGKWEHRYTSPVQKAVTDKDHDAAFTPMGVRVILPHIEGDPESTYYYRVTIKVMWYRNNGSVSGTSRMRVQWFDSYDGAETQEWYCRSWDDGS